MLLLLMAPANCGPNPPRKCWAAPGKTTPKPHDCLQIPFGQPGGKGGRGGALRGRTSKEQELCGPLPQAPGLSPSRSLLSPCEMQTRRIKPGAGEAAPSFPPPPRRRSARGTHLNDKTREGRKKTRENGGEEAAVCGRLSPLFSAAVPIPIRARAAAAPRGEASGFAAGAGCGAGSGPRLPFLCPLLLLHLFCCGSAF